MRKLVLLCLMCLAVLPAMCAQPATRLVFDIDQGFGNGIVVHDDQVALGRVIDGLRPLRAHYDVYVLVNPMVADRRKLDHVLDTLAAAKLPFAFEAYSSDGETLGSCSEQNRPFDPRHGLTISIDDLAAYKKRYGKMLAGLRFMEVFGQDLTVRAVKTTNPEWALPCWKLPEDAFFQPEIADRYIRFAKKNGMWVQWNEWHWYEFASWDTPQKEHEARLAELLRRYPGVVTVTYANNEPEEASAKRFWNWEKSVAKLVEDGAAGYGLSDQSWLSKSDEDCPVDDIIRWAKSALIRDCELIQFEPAWYFFKLPRGTFGMQDYTSDPKWSDRGTPTTNFVKLREALMNYGEAANTREDGYRGIWYSNQPSKDEYVYKYSGGMATYTAYHSPMAIYSPEADKTFFVYGGMRSPESGNVLMMVSYFDHKTGKVPKPTLVLEKETARDSHDAHHNPAISIDDRGYIWVFCPSHGGTDSYIYRSRKPYSIDAFDFVLHKVFSYPEPWFFKGFGHMFLFTKYTGGRELYVSTSPDGVNWSEDKKIAGFAGHYQVGWAQGKKRGTAFNWHPPKIGLNGRTNLYYVESSDFGKTWTNAAGKVLETPLDSVENDALVHNYQADGLLVYVQDMVFDRNAHPVVLYTLSPGYESGPKNDPRVWTIAHWTGAEWRFHKVAESDHNYDTGAIYIDDGAWRVIGPTARGPQPYGTGGEIEVWESRNEGETWTRVKRLTSGSKYNQSFVRRPVDAHPDFYAFWADGDAFKPSQSRIYFTNKAMDRIWVLPEKMEAEFEAPRLVK